MNFYCLCFYVIPLPGHVLSPFPSVPPPLSPYIFISHLLEMMLCLFLPSFLSLSLSLSLSLLPWNLVQYAISSGFLDCCSVCGCAACRSSHDGARPVPIPSALLELVQGALLQAQAVSGAGRLPPVSPDVCLCNFYEKSVSFGAPASPFQGQQMDPPSSSVYPIKAAVSRMPDGW